MILLSGLLPHPIIAIGSNAIILSIASTVFMFYLGISISANIRIGNHLGGNLPSKAKLVTYLSLGLGVCMALLNASALIIFKNYIPILYTHDHDMIQTTLKLITVCAIFQLGDSINACIQGIFRGCGRQYLGAILNFIAYYIVGIPLGILLAFNGLLPGSHDNGFGVIGLWIGITIGLFVVATFGTLLITFKSNWKVLAKEAQNRIKKDTETGSGDSATGSTSTSA